MPLKAFIYLVLIGKAQADLCTKITLWINNLFRRIFSYGSNNEMKLRGYQVSEQQNNGVLTSDKEGVMFGLKPTL